METYHKEGVVSDSEYSAYQNSAIVPQSAMEHKLREWESRKASAKQFITDSGIDQKVVWDAWVDHNAKNLKTIDARREANLELKRAMGWQ